MTVLNVNKCVICGVKFSSSAEHLATSLNGVTISLLNESQVYNNFLKPQNVMPETKVTFLNSKKMNAKLFISLLINKKNTKHYFYGAILLLFCSMFLRFTTYYVIFSTILLILALLSFYSDTVIKNGNKTVEIKNIEK